MTSSFIPCRVCIPDKLIGIQPNALLRICAGETPRSIRCVHYYSALYRGGGGGNRYRFWLAFYPHQKDPRTGRVRNGQTTVTQYYSLFALMLRGERLAGGDRWINPSYLCLRSFVTSRVTRGCNYIIGESWMDSFNPLHSCFCLGSFVTNRVTRVPRM